VFSGCDVCQGLNWGGDAEVALDEPLNLRANTFSFDFDVNYVNPDTDERFVNPDMVGPFTTSLEGSNHIRVKRVKGTANMVANGDLEKTKERRVTVAGGTRTVTTASGTTRLADVALAVTLAGGSLAFDGASGSFGDTTNGTVETMRL
jgi:hypothetical protein